MASFWGKNMIGFILTGHGGFAGGLYSSIKMIAGEQDELSVVEFHDDETASEFPQRLRSVISGYAESDDEVIVFCGFAECQRCCGGQSALHGHCGTQQA